MRKVKKYRIILLVTHEHLLYYSRVDVGRLSNFTRLSATDIKIELNHLEMTNSKLTHNCYGLDYVVLPTNGNTLLAAAHMANSFNAQD